MTSGCQSKANNRGRARSSAALSYAAAAVLCVGTLACKASEDAKTANSVEGPQLPASSHSGAGAAAPAPASPPPSASGAPSIHALSMRRLDGSETSLSAWAGQVLLVVNTASHCGYTPQYQGLQELHAKYSGRGFAVLGFPSNDFGGQEPGTSAEIAEFCISMYNVNFPMFEKVKTIGEERSALYALLSDAQGAPKWNFHKYLVDKQGQPIRAWPSAVEPGSAEIASAIEMQLAAN